MDKNRIPLTSLQAAKTKFHQNLLAMFEERFGRSLERKYYFKLFIWTYVKRFVLAQAGYCIQMGCFQRMAENDVQVVYHSSDFF
jgi:hypothetical protein